MIQEFLDEMWVVDKVLEEMPQMLEEGEVHQGINLNMTLGHHRMGL